MTNKKLLLLLVSALSTSLPLSVCAESAPLKFMPIQPTIHAHSAETFDAQAGRFNYINGSDNSSDLRSITHPTQIQNGSFNDNTAWAHQQFGRNGTDYLQYDGPIIRSGQNGGFSYNNVALLGAHCWYFSMRTSCADSGVVSQVVKVDPYKKLRFNWKSSQITYFIGVSSYTATPDSIVVRILDSQTGALLATASAETSFTTINSFDNTRATEIDLARFANMVVRIEFGLYRVAPIHPLLLPGQESYRMNAWVDDIEIRDNLATYSGGPVTGNWYNPFRSGSGWELRQAPNGSHYAMWFTYNQAGQPVWYVSTEGQFSSGYFQAGLLECKRPSSQPRANCANMGRISLRLSSPYHGVMRADFNNLNGAGTWDSEENFELLTQHRGKSGWFDSGQPQDTNWGITAFQTPTSWGGSTNGSLGMYVMVHHYDELGNPTWTVGNTANGVAFNNGDLITAQRLTGGLCPTCEGVFPLVNRRNVGTVQLDFDTANNASVLGVIYINEPYWYRSSRRYYKLL